MATLRGEVANYGSTQVGLRGIPSGMLDHIHHTTTNSKHPSSPSSWNTKKAVVLGIIGLTTAVVSSATLFFSGIMDSSGPARTGESFLLNDSDGADDDTCVAASGPWPIGSVSTNEVDDDDGPSGPYVTCFASTTGGYCWSHSYYAGDGDWQPCKPNGFGEAWAFVSLDHTHLETCGTACTEFSQEFDYMEKGPLPE